MCGRERAHRIFVVMKVTVGRMLCFLVGLVLSGLSFAQHDVMRFRGSAVSWEKDSALKELTITAVDTADATRMFRCTGADGCRLKLPLDRGYRVEYTAPGHVPKHVLINLSGPTLKQRKWGYDLRLRLVLMPCVKDVDYSVCERPMGLLQFEPGPNQFTWDERYLVDLEAYLETMHNAYERALGRGE